MPSPRFPENPSPQLKAATAFLRWASRGRLFGRDKAYYRAGHGRAEADGVSLTTRLEFEDENDLFQSFQGGLTPDTLADKDLLDLGCGYGGRALRILQRTDCRSIVGLDTSFKKIAVAERSVRNLSPDPRISFVVGVGEEMPFRDESFDAVLSFHVFEHVQDLARVLAECRRVLRPGGSLYAVFPPYFGPQAHHLGFVTTFPFIHLVFSPRVLVEAVNRVLGEQPEIGVRPLPAPPLSYLRREVIPTLNGTTELDFRRLVAASSFQADQLDLLPLGWAGHTAAHRVVNLFCRTMLRMPWPCARDAFVSVIRCRLRKSG